MGTSSIGSRGQHLEDYFLLCDTGRGYKYVTTLLENVVPQTVILSNDLHFGRS